MEVFIGCQNILGEILLSVQTNTQTDYRIQSTHKRLKIDQLNDQKAKHSQKKFKTIHQCQCLLALSSPRKSTASEMWFFPIHTQINHPDKHTYIKQTEMVGCWISKTLTKHARHNRCTNGRKRSQLQLTLRNVAFGGAALMKAIFLHLDPKY